MLMKPMNKHYEQAVIDLQLASQHSPCPTPEHYQQWVDAALTHLKITASELTIRVVDEGESQQLNNSYRQKNKPTNILSFPSELPDFIEQPLLGDLIVCAPIVAHEALEQNKAWTAHWAHIIIHGTLHLLGYDHIEEQEAEHMEALEISILSELGMSNPYETDDAE